MDWIIHDELGLTVGHLVNYAAASAMVVGGVIPYIPQYREIKQTQDPEGFSLHVCFALLIANSLRILFWFYKNYELPLLVQSVVMNVTMFLMIHLCVKVRRNNALIQRTRERVFSDDLRVDRRGGGGSVKSLNATLRDVTMVPESGSSVLNESMDSGAPGGDNSPNSPSRRGKPRHYLSDFDRRYFWQWTDFQSYFDFMLLVWAIGAAITYLMLSVDWFMETVGFLAVFVEAMLGAPQFARNFSNKSTHGMSIHMVIMWTIGDMFKTVYYVLRHAPMQFWICGMLQVSLDFAILFQVFLYAKNSSSRAAAQHRGD